MNCQCHLYNIRCSYCNNLEHGENKDEPFQTISDVSLQLLPSSFENIQNNINGVKNNYNEVQVHMQEENIDESSNCNKAQNDKLEVNSPRNDDQEPINPEIKEENPEITGETKEIVGSLGDVPIDYQVFLKDIKMLMETKYESSDDNEFLICNNNGELLIQNANINDSSLFLDFNTDAQKNNQKKENNINEDIKIRDEKNDNYFKSFYEENKRFSENIIDLLELNCENNSFYKRETSNMMPAKNISINYEIKKDSNCIFKTQIIQDSDKNKESKRKNKNSLHLSPNKKSNPKNQKTINNNESKKKMGNIFFDTKKFNTLNKKESEDLPKENPHKRNYSCLIGLNDIKESQNLQISKNTSFLTNLSTSKGSGSINKSNISNSFISAPPLDNSLSNINLNNKSFSAFSPENNNVNIIEKLNKTAGDNFCNKKRKRREGKKIKVKMKKTPKNEFNDESQLNSDMKNNYCENINDKLNNINNSIDNPTNNNSKNNKTTIKPKNNSNSPEKSETENAESKDTNKTSEELTENYTKKKQKILDVIGEDNIKKRKNNDNKENERRIYEFIRSLYREYRKYLLDKKGDKIRELSNDIYNDYLYNEIKYIKNDQMQKFFSDNLIYNLYEEFLADKDYDKNLEEKYQNFINSKDDPKKKANTILGIKLKKDNSFQKCRKNIHKIYNKEYKNELELE